MSRISFLFAFASLLLAACNPTNLPAVSGTVDSGVRSLKPQMTGAEVEAINGAHQFESFYAADGIISCRSYVYDETLQPKYVHVLFVEGKLVRANDQHTGVCELAPDTE